MTVCCFWQYVVSVCCFWQYVVSVSGIAVCYAHVPLILLQIYLCFISLLKFISPIQVFVFFGRSTIFLEKLCVYPEICLVNSCDSMQGWDDVSDATDDATSYLQCSVCSFEMNAYASERCKSGLTHFNNSLVSMHSQLNTSACFIET